MSNASPKRSIKDLSRAVAFLALERVQQSSDDTKTAFLAGKGFTQNEIVEAKRQAEDVLRRKRSTGSTSSDGYQTFGGVTASADPLTTIGHVTELGVKASTRVMLGGGSISFVSLASGPDDGITTPQAQVKSLLARLETMLASTPSPRDKADVAVIYLSVKGLERCEEEVHEALDCWVDALAPPTRFVIEQTGKRNMVQLMAVVRG
jgi:ElaB/YqjD/DUF883 family membrane-anchored ribosome-binding protein|eukprot:evm.model.NODE_3239_length_31224_cov_31.538591.6